MDYLKKLNANQLAAAKWDVGPLLVLAGPGSGKTATLTSRVARLVEESQGESFRILCLTFTRKAATEMRERLLALVPDAKDRALLTTFHSFAADILRQHGSHYGLSPDFEVIDDSERLAPVKFLLARHSDKLTRFVSAEKALTALDFLFRNVVPDSEVASLLKDEEVGLQLSALFTSYKDFLKEQNCLDYGAMLYFCEELLRQRPRVAKQLQTVYRYICVDEFQDTNVAQYRVLRALAPQRDANVFIVGDDDQIIYQWNGASPARVNELESHYDLTTIQLPENYRCPPEVVALANALIAHNSERATGKKPLLPMKPETGLDPVEVEAFDDDSQEASWVAEQIQYRLSAGSTPHDLVVLARNSKLLERAHKALGAVSVPSHLQKRKTQFESAPLRFVVAALKLALVHQDDDLAATVTKALSDCIDADVDMVQLGALSAESSGDQVEALRLLALSTASMPKDLRDAIAALARGGYAEFVRTALTYFDFMEGQDLNEKGDERFAEYTTERQVWKGIIQEMGGETEAYEMSLGQFLQELALANKTPEAPSNAVRCLTIHASKGMEFRHVFLVGLAEDQLPSFQSKKAGDTSREMQEERRNCFVAITRTIETLTLTFAHKYNGWRKEPSRFLREMGLIDGEEQ